MNKNKVQFGLNNVHIAPVIETEDGITYGTPHKHPGAVNMTLSPAGNVTPFYADNVEYFRSTSNQGYTGTLEFALHDEWYHTNILKEEKDADGVLIENANAQPARFAMLYEVDGDVHAARRVLYNVKTERPGETNASKGESAEPQTSTSNISVAPLPDTRDIKASTTESTPQKVFDDWYKSVHMRNGSDATATLSALTIGSIAISPTFDAEIKAYTAATTNATNTISVTATSASATIAIKANGTATTNGNPITWNTGSNSVVITVTNGAATETYTVTVTKTTA